LTFQDLTHPDDLDLDLKYVQQMIAGKIETYQMEKRYFHKNGSIVWVLLSVSLAKDNDKKPLFFISQIEDITERKLAKEELQKSEERYKSIVEDMPMMMCRFKADGTLTFINQFYCQYFNKSYEQLLGSNLFDLIPPEEQETVKQKYLSLNQEKPFVTYEYRTIDNKGKVNWQRWTDRALFDENGNIYEYQSIGEDVTERRTAETLLQSENQIMQMIASGADVHQTLNTICLNVQSFLQTGLCSILLLDKDGIRLKHGAAPSLPKEYIQAIDNSPIGAKAGSCGTAAFRKERVIVKNIATDPLWEDYKEIALKHGLHACWSTPIMNEENQVYGTFAIYYPQPQIPAQAEIDLINRASYQAKIVIEKSQADELRKESEQRYRSLFEDSPISLWEDDYSAVKQKIEELKQNGITDFSDYFTKHPEATKELSSLINIIDTNS
ncbi:MAG: PAS domain S-box protein, partial [Anaerolineales bacterium]